MEIEDMNAFALDIALGIMMHKATIIITKGLE